MFEVALREDSHEERQNQLRWQVKLGEDPMSSEAKQKLLDERERAWDEYKVDSDFSATLVARNLTLHLEVQWKMLSPCCEKTCICSHIDCEVRHWQVKI